jgi:hypothetical protein
LNPAEAEFVFHATAMSLFCIIQRITVPKFGFVEIFYHTSLYGPVARVAIVDPTSQVCSFAVLVLLIAGN